MPGQRRYLLPLTVTAAIAIAAAAAALLWLRGSSPPKADPGAAIACRQLDSALADLHQTVTATPRPYLAVAATAGLAEQRVGAAATLTAGRTRQAMQSLATYTRQLAARERQWSPLGDQGFNDDAEVAGVRTAYAQVLPLCEQAGVRLAMNL